MKFSITVGRILNHRHSVHSAQILTLYLESSPNNFSKLQEVRISKGVHTFKVMTGSKYGTYY
jgi:hypothetical protein